AADGSGCAHPGRRRTFVRGLLAPRRRCWRETWFVRSFGVPFPARLTARARAAAERVAIFIDDAEPTHPDVARRAGHPEGRHDAPRSGRVRARPGHVGGAHLRQATHVRAASSPLRVQQRLPRAARARGSRAELEAVTMPLGDALLAEMCAANV